MKFRNYFLLILCAHSAFSFAQTRDPSLWGKAYMAEGNTIAAKENFTEAAKKNPFDPIALNNLAVTKAAAGDYQMARDLLSRASQLAPTNKDIASNFALLQNWNEKNSGFQSSSSQSYYGIPQPEEVPSLWGGSSPLMLSELQNQKTEFQSFYSKKKRTQHKRHKLRTPVCTN